MECAGALLVLGQRAEARNILRYLIATQRSDGRWDQNQWLEGEAFWQGVQLDEAGFPVLLAALLAQRDALDGIEAGEMVQRALGFIARSGPSSDQDRWEEDAGVNTFTLAICIAALVSGAPFLAAPERDLALAIADDWNARIEAFTAVHDTALAKRLGVRGYYVRVAPACAILDKDAFHQRLPIKNRVQDPMLPAEDQIATDLLQLVRFGLRRPDDPLILDSIKVIDALLKAQTPSGPAWRRYNADGYGEHEDGAPYDGTGLGRPWPLLTGERGHYELLAGRDPLPYLQAMARMASAGGMLPEQIWDGTDVPERELFKGRPTGSAMPLVWAHAEHLKLRRSLNDGRVYDLPPQTWQRYVVERTRSSIALWRFNHRLRTMVRGDMLRIQTLAPCVVHWSADEWRTIEDTPSTASGLGDYYTDLPTRALATGDAVLFTFRWVEVDRWEGVDFRVAVVA